MLTSDKLVLLPAEVQSVILQRLYSLMEQQGIECALISSNANMFYLTGRVFCGYILLCPPHAPIYFVKRPQHLQGEGVELIHKPENIPACLERLGITLPATVALELGATTYNTVQRLAKALGDKRGAATSIDVGHDDEIQISDISGIMSKARSVKTPYEINRIRTSGVRHTSVYRQIPALYRPGMSDVELQVEIERLSRLEGCLGQFRVAGTEMELFMGNVLAGDNAGEPSPFDFAMGGAGIDPSLPIGANGTIIRPGMAVMVDMNGNFNGYMTDMTRTFALGNASDLAQRAHQLSIDICHTLADMGREGVEAKALYDRAYEMAKDADLEKYFMGYRQHAGFVGHGIGIEVNESPVLAPRSRDILTAGNVIAIEPKFVIPGVGAVGIENTYVVKADQEMECLTSAPEMLINFD